MIKKYIGAFVLTFLLVFSYHITTNTFSKYQSSIDKAKSAEVAVAIFEDSINTITVPIEIYEPGDSFEYTFSITNTNELKTSEVALEYNIRLSVSTNLPLEYKLYEEDDRLNIFDATLTSPTYRFNAGETQINNYKLVINWPSNENDYHLANMTEKVIININSDQVIH